MSTQQGDDFVSAGMAMGLVAAFLRLLAPEYAEGFFALALIFVTVGVIGGVALARGREK